MLRFKQYLAEINVKDLVDGTNTFQSDTGAQVDRFIPQANSVKLNKVTFWKGTKQVLFTFDINSFTDPKKYNVNIMFNRIEFADEKKDPSYIMIDNVWFKKPNVIDNPVQVRCGCLDFRHRASYVLSKRKGLFGRVISYKKKTDRPPLNPDPPGYELMCKHLHNCMIALSDNGYLENLTV